jgi:hypothetical protein
MTNEEFQKFDDDEYYDNKIRITLKNSKVLEDYLLYYSYQEDDEDIEFDSLLLQDYKEPIYSNEVESVEIIKE